MKKYVDLLNEIGICEIDEVAGGYGQVGKFMENIPIVDPYNEKETLQCDLFDGGCTTNYGCGNDASC